MVWFTAISLSPSRLPFYLPKTLMNWNYLWTKESLSSVLCMASFLKSPGCYLSPLFVADLTTLSQLVAAVVQPCQDQVELERKKEKSWQKQRCLLQWQITQLTALKLGFKGRKDGDWGGGSAAKSLLWQSLILLCHYFYRASPQH